MLHKSTNADIYQRITDEVIKQLENGQVIWRKGWHTLGLPKNFITGKSYRGWNTFSLNFIVALRGFKTPWFLTYKQALAAGGNVRKGEKGFTIVYWAAVESKTLSIIVKDRSTGEESSKPVTRLIPKTHVVFNVDQTEGIEIPTIEGLFKTEVEKVEACEKVIAEMPLCPQIRHGGDEAFYVPKADYIQLPFRAQFRSTEDYYKTAFHELTHSTGHPKRLNRKELVESDGFGKELYSKEELTAEMGAAFLCALCGIGQSDIANSAAYIKGWLKVLKNDRTLLLKAAGQAQTACDYILNAQPATESESMFHAA